MTDNDKTILVTTATGKQGSATARRLLADGWRVRALVRDPDSASARALAAAGAELVRGDFDDTASIKDAVTGAHGVFLAPPATYTSQSWDVEREYRRGTTVVDAAVAARVERIVFTGVASFRDGAELPGSSAKWRIERRIRDSGVPFTLLRPVRFLENYLLRDSPVDGIHDGVHRHMFHPDRPVQVIAVDDIGRFAAAAFTDPGRYEGETLELAGDAATPVEAAAAISAALGREIRYEQVPFERAAALGAEIGETWKRMDGGDGWHADIPALRELHPGLLRLEQWLAAGGAGRIKAAIGG